MLKAGEALPASTLRRSSGVRIRAVAGILPSFATFVSDERSVMSKTSKLPKRVGGIEIPKALRKNAKPLVRHLTSFEGKALLATAFYAATAVLAEQNFAAGKWTMKKVKRRLAFVAAKGQDRTLEIAAYIGRAEAHALTSHTPGEPAPVPQRNSSNRAAKSCRWCMDLLPSAPLRIAYRPRCGRSGSHICYPTSLIRSGPTGGCC
ncbi:hypothetical protein NOVOSPHI9U_580006 [Novosphingobium sp. 9U]|nr:hypothetical protein NOVOSPHI9U_580006 [Novosphingobium sp. 9U]